MEILWGNPFVYTCVMLLGTSLAKNPKLGILTPSLYFLAVTR